MRPSSETKYEKYFESEFTECLIDTNDLSIELDNEEEELRNSIDFQFKLV